MTDLIAELAEVVRLSGKATPGEWERGYGNDTGPDDDYFVEWEEVGPMQAHGSNGSADADYIAALHNLFRRRRDEIEAMARERDALNQQRAELAEACRYANKGYVYELNRAESLQARIDGAPVVTMKQLAHGIVPGDYAVPWDWNEARKRVALVVLEGVK